MYHPYRRVSKIYIYGLKQPLVETICVVCTLLGLIVNIFSFGGYIVSVKTTLTCYYSMEAAIRNT